MSKLDSDHSVDVTRHRITRPLLYLSIKSFGLHSGDGKKGQTQQEIQLITWNNVDSSMDK